MTTIPIDAEELEALRATEDPLRLIAGRLCPIEGTDTCVNDDCVVCSCRGVIARLDAIRARVKRAEAYQRIYHYGDRPDDMPTKQADMAVRCAYGPTIVPCDHDDCPLHGTRAERE